MAGIERAASADEQGPIFDRAMEGERGGSLQLPIHIDAALVLGARPRDDEMVPLARAPI